MTDQRPTCERCGLPARYVKARASVHVTLNADGSLGKVNRASNVEVVNPVTHVCGLGHEWTLTTAHPSPG